MYFCAGEMAERSNAAVLKTVDCHRSGGSNPSLSAKSKTDRCAKPVGFFALVLQTFVELFLAVAVFFCFGNAI
jgi:hypothetical protein